MWVHQRRAHIRVLYDKFKQQLVDRHASSQGLLFPERLELSAGDSVVLESIIDELLSLGFDISSLGGGTYAINGVPSGIEGLSPVNLIVEIVAGVAEQTIGVTEALHAHLAGAMAKKVAIVIGQVLTDDEMKKLVDDLFKTSMPSRTHDGRTIIYIMQDGEIERNFAK